MNTFNENQEVNSDSTGLPKEPENEIESPFNGIIGQCFFPYLYIYINSVDR